ncbi:MAG: bifunctional demethylmenaquinone methyltransferase/2-methoxy-6-polyprenyl-1,4-benzoquinol methylase UbiE [Chloroflexota bacterium]|nr:MAG: bifunctional demethylmenaquinone methyltransferase/2-methoxy-6-polyprenyl-1,4-benzoquinol methylase UbiE [Chloroflexota bacterium]
MSQPLKDQRADYVVKMFGAIADHYDLMNRVMTFGQDQRWRRQAAEAAQLHPGDTALDVATGTGDLAFELIKHVQPRGHVVGIDFAEPMLSLARRKASIRRIPVSFEAADALNLPFADRSFCGVTCGFGLRNVEDRTRALAEMARVTRLGRRVVILELTPPSSELARKYMDEIVPRMGQLIARAREAYSYLPESVKDFPDAQHLGRMMQNAGLRQVKYRLMNFGTVALHWGERA